ncbi:hypothetical protein GGTG_13242 [Gaeumannomyces tritici R3-111a-1]|uniref:Uncharacterized protein n=1 Tax=Gaeumannomyces tritici (strain R3-111a-1) TaxID=644352 RepID=J3PIB4_GAET3|nr:hypothetical protein GGTG_13242 [Gaeumannomyces tritici R3-111a-1]EJT69133.1 hypothetical protein GGTG_13242 [Gaeumannomyces tritici R3-111a-1]
MPTRTPRPSEFTSPKPARDLLELRASGPLRCALRYLSKPGVHRLPRSCHTRNSLQRSHCLVRLDSREEAGVEQRPAAVIEEGFVTPGLVLELFGFGSAVRATASNLSPYHPPPICPAALSKTGLVATVCSRGSGAGRGLNVGLVLVRVGLALADVLVGSADDASDSWPSTCSSPRSVARARQHVTKNNKQDSLPFAEVLSFEAAGFAATARRFRGTEARTSGHAVPPDAHIPHFLAIFGACSVVIFNYQKMSSPVVASTLYALRVSPEDGSKIDLLAGSDPFRGMQLDKSLENYLNDNNEEDQPTTRGFRQMARNKEATRKALLGFGWMWEKSFRWRHGNETECRGSKATRKGKTMLLCGCRPQPFLYFCQATVCQPITLHELAFRRMLAYTI